jgi:hypothetical protein
MAQGTAVLFTIPLLTAASIFWIGQELEQSHDTALGFYVDQITL